MGFYFVSELAKPEARASQLSKPNLPLDSHPPHRESSLARHRHLGIQVLNKKPISASAPALPGNEDAAGEDVQLLQSVSPR